MHRLAPSILGTLCNCWTQLHTSSSWWSQETRWIYPPERSRLERRRKIKCHFRLLAEWSPLSKSELAPLSPQGNPATFAFSLPNSLWHFATKSLDLYLFLKFSLYKRTSFFTHLAYTCSREEAIWRWLRIHFAALFPSYNYKLLGMLSVIPNLSTSVWLQGPKGP